MLMRLTSERVLVARLNASRERTLKRHAAYMRMAKAARRLDENAYFHQMLSAARQERLELRDYCRRRVNV
jgi:hypothetical protein